MLFDLELDLDVTFGTVAHAHSARTCIRLKGGSLGEHTHRQWEVVRYAHPATAHLAKKQHTWRWVSKNGQNIIVLETENGHSWASLNSFPAAPKLGDKGSGGAYNLPIAPPDPAMAKIAGSAGNHPLNWTVLNSSRVTADENDRDGIWNNIKSRPTGWSYDTSAGKAGGAGNFGIGFGGAMGHLIFKRHHNGREEKCRIDYKLEGAGFMFPGWGGAESTEQSLGGGSRVFTGLAPDYGSFEASRFEGGLTVVDLGGGVNLGYGGGIGKGLDGYLFMFTNGVFGSKVPNPFAVKALFCCYGFSTSAGGAGKAGQLLAFGGTATLHR